MHNRKNFPYLPRNKLYSAFNRKTSAYFPLPVTRFKTKHFTKKGVSPKDPHLMDDGEPYQKSWRLYINKDFGIPNKETRQFHGEFPILYTNYDAKATIKSAHILRKAPQNGTL